MKNLIYDIDIGDRLSHVEIAPVIGAGYAMFHVYQEKYYILRIWKTEDNDWRWDHPDNSKLYSEDIRAIIDMIIGYYGEDPPEHLFI